MNLVVNYIILSHLLMKNGKLEFFNKPIYNLKQITNNQQPTTNNQQPITNNKKLTTNNQQLIERDEKQHHTNCKQPFDYANLPAGKLRASHI